MAELIKLKIEQLEKALKSLREALSEPKTDLVRDAAIQRFEYTFELFWKATKMVLEQKGVATYSPKDCLRELRNIEIFSDDETEAALEMATDRNLSVHTYNEDFAERLYGRLVRYAEIFEKFLQKLDEQG